MVLHQMHDHLNLSRTQSSLLGLALCRANENARPPIWFMRQAGRYHSHYQAIRARHSFLDMCKTPQLAAEIALGPVEDFDFDAAILFSDILFPIEAMLANAHATGGQNSPPLDFAPGPVFSHYLATPADLEHYQPLEHIAPDFFDFQAEALLATRKRLLAKTNLAEKALIAFVGGPLTLYLFAVAGSLKKGENQAGLEKAANGFRDGRFDGFMERLGPILLHNMKTQANAAPDCMAILDSHAGDIGFDLFRDRYFPFLEKLVRDFHQAYPHLPILYYGKHFTPDHWRLLAGLPIACFGVDHSQNLPALLDEFGGHVAFQGNFDQEALTLPPSAFEPVLQDFITRMKAVPRSLRHGWICGLGHGLTPGAREENVRRFIDAIRTHFI